MTNFFSLAAFICALGWIAHWLASWGEQWKINKSSLLDYIESNLPAFWYSIVITVAVYLVGPGLLKSVGVDLPIDAITLRNLAAFIAGYLSDSIVYKISNLLRKT